MTSSPNISPAPDLLRQGHERLARGEWEEARRSLEAALEHGETPEALEALGLAAWGLNDAAMVFHARERAYELYRQHQDPLGAARMAACLALDHLYYRGEYALAIGWIQRGRRLLEDVEASAEHGWLAVAEAHLAMWTEHDFAAAQKLCAQAVTVGKRFADVDLEMAALAGQGLSLVSQGRIRDGMRCLDEATMAAVAGEMTDVDAACTACCCLIFACEWTRDYQRASQWIGRLRDLAVRWSHPTLIYFCRIHYASLLIWQGAWEEAEAELLEATQALEQTQPALAAEAFVRLAELRCKQGRLDEASALLDRAETPPFRALAGHFLLSGRAHVALGRGEVHLATELAERFLRALPAEDRMERVTGLEVLIEASTACGDFDRAEAVMAELQSIGSRVDTIPMQATIRYAEGLVSAAAGEHDSGRYCFEDAVDLWSRAGAPFEAARARRALARSLHALGRMDDAEEQSSRAAETFEELGASASWTRLESSQRAESPTTRAPSNSHDGAAFTDREEEILLLVVEGKSNQEIADALFLSVRTVERHLSNVYQKIGASGKSARAAAVAHALKNGLA